MPSATFSFRAPSELAAQTMTLATELRMTSSACAREAVREKNERTVKERTVKERMICLSGKLAALNLAENQSMSAANGDGLREVATEPDAGGRLRTANPQG